MLNSCIEIFKKVAKDDMNQYILDHYIPANGTYIMLKENSQDFVEKAVYEVKVDKKTGLTNLSDHEKNLVAAVDYPSQLMSPSKLIRLESELKTVINE